MPIYSQAALTVTLLCVSSISSMSSAWIQNPASYAIRSSSHQSSTTQLYVRPSALSRQPPAVLNTPSTENLVEKVTSSSTSAPTDVSLPGGVSLPIPSPIQETVAQIMQTEKATEEVITNVEKSSASSLLDIFNSIDSIFNSLQTKVTDTLIQSIPKDELSNIITKSIDVAKDNSRQLDDALLSNPTLGPVVSLIQSKITSLSPLLGEQISSSTTGLQPTVALLSSAIITYSVTSSLLNMNEGPPPSSPYPLGKYNPSTARVYFDTRLNEVVGRGLQIASQSLVFGLALLSDKLK